jgi:hypothetical protein
MAEDADGSTSSTPPHPMTPTTRREEHDSHRVPPAQPIEGNIDQQRDDHLSVTQEQAAGHPR